LWNISKADIETFLKQANSHHPTIKFTADIFDTETVFLVTVVYRGTRFKAQSILDTKTHFKPTETFQYTHFTSCHPPSVKNGFVKGECLRSFHGYRTYTEIFVKLCLLIVCII